MKDNQICMIPLEKIGGVVEKVTREQLVSHKKPNLVVEVRRHFAQL